MSGLKPIGSITMILPLNKMMDNYFNYVISGAAPVAFTVVGLPMTQDLQIGADLAVGYTMFGSWLVRREM